MTAALPLMVVLPLLAAALSVLVGRSRRTQRILGLTTLTALIGLSIAIFVHVDDHGTVAVQAGGWPAPVGITLVADRLSALLLVTATTVLLGVLIYAIGQPGAERNHVGFQSVYLVLAAGVSAAFLTGDLFNLFVSIEMMLTASYVLMTLGGQLEQVRSGMTYVVISLVASVLFLLALAFVYASTGTVNLADLPARIAELPDGIRAALAAMLLIVFGIKAALFPLYFWLPDSYPTAPAAVTAIFAGLLTKVGVYAIIRTQTLLFPESSRPQTLILVIAALTMLVGVLGAIAQEDLKRIFSFYIVSQIGYIVMALGLFTVAGLAGAVYAIVHHIVLKTALFLTGGLVEQHAGTSRLNSLGNVVATAPTVAVMFLLPALSLAGIPPFSGFVAKYGIFQAAAAEGQWAMLATGVLVGLLTLFSIFKVWVAVFWSPAQADAPIATASADVDPAAPEVTRPLPAMMRWPTALLALATLGLGVAAGPIYAASERAAQDLLDPQQYIEAVLRP